MKKKLVVNADDFGITEAVSDAIVQVYKNGSLSSTTMLVNMPGTFYASRLALQHPGLGVGLHFNITEGKSLAGPSSITDEKGFFLHRYTLLKKMLLGRVEKSDIANELNVQYMKFCELGLSPTHIDSHQHVHMFPIVFKFVADFALGKSLPLRITYSQSLFRTRQRNFSLAKYLKQRFLNLAVRTNKIFYTNNLSNNSFNSIFDIHPFQNPDEADYKFLITSAKGDFHELMVHPYLLSDQLKEVYSSSKYAKKALFFSKAIKEYEVLTKFSIRDWLQSSKSGFEMVTYRELKNEK